MSERVSVSFADATNGIQGVAIAAVGTLLRVGVALTALEPAVFAQERESWRVSVPGACELTLLCWGAGAALSDDGTHVWPCAAAGSVGARSFDGLAILAAAGQAQAGELARALAIPFDAELALALRARRARGAAGHGEELLDAVVFRGRPLEPAPIQRPRLSSTYDANGSLAHVGIELWESEESELPMRIGGEAIAHGELCHPDGAMSAVTFIDWHHSGRHALGSYTITTRA